jgi:hypothetical protein
MELAFESSGASARASSRFWALSAPFEARGLLQSQGAKWEPTTGAWLYKGESLPLYLTPFKAPEFSWEALLEAHWNQEAPRHAGPAGSVALREHQAEARRLIALARKAGLPGFLLADEVGLGKTYSAWAAVLDAVAERRAAGEASPDVLVVAPLSALPHWRRSIKAMGTGGARVLVINYDRLQKLFAVAPEKKAKVKSRKGVARMGEAPRFALQIFDESHKLKNPAAARSKFAAKIASAGGFTLWLSATAGQTPLELSYLARLFAAKTGQRASEISKDFEAWCLAMQLGVSRGKFGKWEWDGSEQSKAKARALLFEPSSKLPAAALRRRPEEIAGWPPIQRIVWPVELEAERRALYDTAWGDFQKAWREGGAAFAKKAQQAGKAKSKAAAALVAALRFRQKSSLLRVEDTVRFAVDLLESGRQVAISCAFRETTQEIAKRLAAEGVETGIVDGSVSADAREAERVRFQTGQLRALCFTVEESISLHEGEMPGGDAPRALLIHDLRWSALQTAQIEGRCHRDGKSAPAYWMLAQETIEERVGERLAARLAGVKALSGDEASVAEELGRMLLEQLEGPAANAAAA